MAAARLSEVCSGAVNPNWEHSVSGKTSYFDYLSVVFYGAPCLGE